MTLPHHLVTVWNPSYASDAMDEHLAVLIDWEGRDEVLGIGCDGIVVRMGRVRMRSLQ